MTPILMLGAGRMGGAMIEGWRKVGAFPTVDLILRDPAPNEAAQATARAGARLNPPDTVLDQASTVLLAVKPQTWRAAVTEIEPFLAKDAVIVSIMAGVKTSDIAQACGGRAVARVMPTTAVAIAHGTATIYAQDEAARAHAHALFAPIGRVVEVEDEELMHAATAVSGSAPAYLYAFVEALEAAGVAVGLSPEASANLARATIAGAAALMAHSDEDPAELRRQVTSPAGTTEAALKVLLGEGGLGPLLEKAVAAAVQRSRELGS